MPVVDNAPTDQLLELLFQLSVTFSTGQFIDGEPSSSMLVFFSGILGFSSGAENFLPAKSYTPYLSGLIYIQRLLFLEYALPFRAWSIYQIRLCPDAAFSPTDSSHGSHRLSVRIMDYLFGYLLIPPQLYAKLLRPPPHSK